MEKSVLGFKLMSIAFKLRDFFSPRINVLNEAGIKPGNSVLDYGCGPGSYILPLSSLVEKGGKIFALDIHPLAIKSAEDISTKNRLDNVKTILSDCETGLPDQSIDVVLLYDTYHDLSNPDEALQEINRILKPEGILSFSDHHMTDKAIKEKITKDNLFDLLKKNNKTYTFSKSA
ncbi:MAG: class I SAM-dependent methyltransferase [Desulfobacterales bacterium]|jgi:ubiquinone/menaquinone biosynthesis C-methylase UbiE